VKGKVRSMVNRRPESGRHVSGAFEVSRRRLTIAFGIITLIGVGIRLVDELMPAAIGEGQFDVSIRVISEPAPVAVVVLVAARRDLEEYARRPGFGGLERDPSATVTSPFAGKPIARSVPVSLRLTGLLHRERSRTSYRHALVIVEFADGRREGRIADLPDRFRPEGITVSFNGPLPLTLREGVLDLIGSVRGRRRRSSAAPFGRPCIDSVFHEGRGNGSPVRTVT
jgi:hypothetical protein